MTDANHDLRRRTRSLTTDLESRIDEGDPAADKEVIERLLVNGINEALGQNAVFIMQGAITLSVRLREHFDNLLGGLPGLNAHALRPVGGFDGGLEIPAAPKRGAAMFTGMRGSYGGIALCGTAVGMAGPALGAAAAAVVLPITLLAGVLFGRKVAQDERARQLAQRRAQAKQNVRRRIEDVLFHENKRRRDVLRSWSRAVRDETVLAADELRDWALQSESQASEAVETYRRQADEWWAGVQLDLAELSRISGLLQSAQSR